ncbi:response regulator transcription factor [Taibaiella soli]|uniref:DNA-binding response regulator n=1 Tax=Taibaiella soli TaxID=1649169 RepID=A0A2W2AKF1_9BACT|nr:response regulator transcription factor [Taibaiella soli]PZF74052.1 DNA-binding response regulator [Taibaiella soli]
MNILLADDHVIIMDGLRLLINSILPNASVCQVKDADALIAHLRHTETELVVCDINMPGGNHPGIVNMIKSIQPKTKLLMLSGFDPGLYANRYLQAGADAYLNKNSNTLEIGNVILALLEGKEQEKFADYNVSPLQLLSNRELEVAQLLIDGNGILEIANLLKLHVNTISTYKARIFEKTNIASIPELVALFQN